MKKLFALLLGLALPAGAYASGAGTTAANFLKVSMGPRAMALAGAYSALGDESGAIFVNPAGLAQSDKREIALDFSTYLQDAKMGNVSYASESGGRRFGLGINYLTVGSIERRGLTDTVGIVPELGSFDASDMAVTLAYARKEIMPDKLPRLDGGIGIKLIRSSIYNKSAYAVAADAGVLYRATEKMNLALALQNLGTEMKYEDESDPLPISLRAGAAYKYSKSLNLAFELMQYFQDEKFYPAFGAEYWLRDAFALRGGYKFGYDTSNLGSEVGLSLGFGVKVAGLGMDYAFLPFGDLGSIHRFGFWMQF